MVQWARDSEATLLQDVGVDHGGTGVRVSQQGLDGANVRTALQDASAVPKMLVNGRSEDVIFFDGVFFESSLKSIFFAS